MCYSIYQSSEGAYIGINANIKNALILPHGLKGIFISGEAEIGENCVIFQQVTIGSNSLPFSKSIGAPIIGNDCYIGAGAKIIGGVKIGDNCRIGGKLCCN
jgi:serine O-acetyltransferase